MIKYFCDRCLKEGAGMYPVSSRGKQYSVCHDCLELLREMVDDFIKSYAPSPIRRRWWQFWRS